MPSTNHKKVKKSQVIMPSSKKNAKEDFRNNLHRRPLSEYNSGIYPQIPHEDSEEETISENDEIHSHDDSTSDTSPNARQRSPYEDYSPSNSNTPPYTIKGQSDLDSSLSPGKPQPEPETKKSTCFSNIFMVFCVIFIIIAGYILSIFQVRYLTVSRTPNVDEIMTKITKEFSEQPPFTFKVVQKVIERAASDDQVSPGIVILLSSRTARDTNDKFATSLARSISSDSDYITIKANNNHSPDQLKKDIDDAIRSNLTKDSFKAVLVRNLDRIPFEAALMFHSYCDHENAPFPKAVYIMSVITDDVLAADSDSKQLDMAASKSLKSAWRDGEEDQVEPLISRLTGSVAFITKQ